MAAGPITFDFPTWTGMFPEFSGCSAGQGAAWFAMACSMCANTASNPMGQQTDVALYTLTSHFAWLLAPRDGNGNPAQAGQPAPAVVGRINSASEGSVSVGSEWSASNASPSQAFFVQTKYGAMFWQMTARTRQFRYAARPTIVANGAFPFRRG